jgi:hypothetical protein
MANAAATYNLAHRELAAEFTKLTGIDAKNFRAVRAWQLKHGLRGDGKIGPETLEAARAGANPEDGGAEEATGGSESGAPEGGGDGKAAGGAKKGGHHHHGGKVEAVTFADDEGSTIEGDSDTSAGGEVLENPNLMDNITGGAAGQEKRETKPTSEKLNEAGGGINDAGEGLHHLAGMEEQPWLKAAMAPAIVQMLREGDYIGAAQTLALTFSPSEYFEGLTLACEKLGIEAGVKFFKHFVAVGAELNVTFEMVMWTYEGLKAIAEAHEKGDRDSRITIYAGEFADAFLYGDGAPRNGGAVTEEQREAAERGHRDGVATAVRTGELAPAIGKQLLRRYGGEKNARQAIIDELLAKAGITGIKTHEGKQ